VYTLLSLLLLVVLGLVFLFDILQLAVREHPDATTQLFSVAILVSVDVGPCHPFVHCSNARARGNKTPLEMNCTVLQRIGYD